MVYYITKRKLYNHKGETDEKDFNWEGNRNSNGQSFR